MWKWIILGMVFATGVSILYTAFRLSRTAWFLHLAEKKKILPFLVCVPAVALIALISK